MPNVARPSDPVDLIRESVNVALGMGVTVSTVPDMGVHCTSQHPPTWERDERIGAVSPLGAVLLARQPPIPSADEALAHALSVSPIWIIGFDEGCAKQKPSEAFANGAAKLLYAQGFEAGTTFRVVMHRRAGVPVERADDRFSPGASMSAGAGNPSGKTPGPVDSDAARERTPRSLLAELLNAHTAPQALEAVADDFRRRRAGPVTPREAVDLDMAEAMLRELAVEMGRPDEEV